MSTDDYTVNPLKDSEVRDFAGKVRESLGWTDLDWVDPISLETATKIWTVRGGKPFKLEFVADDQLPGDAGLTTYDDARILVRIPRKIRHDALMGHGYPRFTMAHEIGHAVLHFDKLVEGAALPRRLGGNAPRAWIPAASSAERQANVFGAALLINDATARLLPSPEEVAIQAGVSLMAAKIYFDQVQEKIARPASILRVQKKAAEHRAIMAQASRETPIAFANDPCTTCGQPTLFPVGQMHMCKSCNAISNRFQDGDSAH